MPYILAEKLACGVDERGKALLDEIPSKIPQLSSEIFTLLLIAVPLLLVVMGTIDLYKGITAQKEDEMVKGRKLFVKRLVTGAIVFLVLGITKFAVSVIDNKTNSSRIINCVDCFIGGTSKCSSQISDSGTWKCTLPVDNENMTLSFTLGIDGYMVVDRAPGMELRLGQNDFTPNSAGDCPDSNEYKAILEKDLENRIMLVNIIKQ